MRKIVLLIIPVILVFFFYVGTAPCKASQKQTALVNQGYDTVPPKDTSKLDLQRLTRIRSELTDSVPKKDSISRLELLARN